MAACGPSEPQGETDPKLAQLTIGMRRDSVLLVLGPPTAEDSLPNISRKEIYLLEGMPYEILFYSPTGAKEGTTPAPAESTLRPIVLRVGQVTGWGWAHFDSLARTNEIRVRIR
jgi:hypothetical protein